MPGIATGAFFGSLGTRKVPQMVAANNGIPMAKTKRRIPPPLFQPQMPIDARADNSSRKRTAKFMGFELIIIPLASYKICLGS